MSAASIAAEVEAVGGSACQCSEHTLHTASNWSAWLSPQKEASSKDDAHKPANSLLKTSRLSTWITGTMTKINLFGSDGVKRVWRQPG